MVGEVLSATPANTPREGGTLKKLVGGLLSLLAVGAVVGAGVLYFAPGLRASAAGITGLGGISQLIGRIPGAVTRVPRPGDPDFMGPVQPPFNSSTPPSSATGGARLDALGR